MFYLPCLRLMILNKINKLIISQIYFKVIERFKLYPLVNFRNILQHQF
jgi:hypothetical protein